MNFERDPNAIYRTPTGRLCRWVAPHGPRRVASVAHFSYLHRKTGLPTQEMVTLTSANWCILQKEVPVRGEGKHAPGR